MSMTKSSEKVAFKFILDDLILDAPKFDEPFDRAFSNWKAYLNKK
jgi:hypothetical protein